MSDDQTTQQNPQEQERQHDWQGPPELVLPDQADQVTAQG